MAFINSTTGWAGGDNGDFFSTTDGGQNWSSVNMNTTDDFNDIFFLSPTFGFAVGNGGNIYRYGGPSGVNELNHGEQLSFYPNPTKDRIYINQLLPGKEYTITVADITGKIKIIQAVTSDAQELSVGDLSDGIYIITVLNEEHITVLKDRLLISK